MKTAFVATVTGLARDACLYTVALVHFAGRLTGYNCSSNHLAKTRQVLDILAAISANMGSPP